MQRPKSPSATGVTSDVGNEDQTPGPGLSRKRSAAARKSSLDEDTGNRDSTQKRRRRAFSCQSCQRLKCRCEFDPGAPGCHRCQTLRIECSLRGQNGPLQNPSPTEPIRSNVEERLQRHDDALQEIKVMIQALGSERTSNNNKSSRNRADSDSHEDEATTTNHERPIDPEYLLNPVDRGSKSAPIVVLREISQRTTRGHRRMIGRGSSDLIQLQLLDEHTASELIELFIKYQGHTLLVRSFEELGNYGGTRQVSPFLHSVCCLIGIVYRDDICGTLLHRQIYEQVRITLSQALLCSPLDLDDLNALFIMSNNANTPSSQGVEYIDSWLLTGYCAKQAMLSIYFTQIVDRVKNGDSTIEDHRAMHLWSMICLHHLQWAATTGRPSVIPKGSHINQCNVLLSFYQATMQDGMLVAEILLYSTLNQKLLHGSYPGDGSECEEFRTWKQKWNHLLVLPTSSMLRIGYHASCLILAVRALGKTGDAPGSSLLLSTDNIPAMASSVSIGSKTGGDQTPPTSASNSADTSEKPIDETSIVDRLRANVCKYAKVVLETFLEMPGSRMDAAPACTCLCIGYCALVLAHYDESQSQIPDTVVLQLVRRLDNWILTSPGKAWSYKYGALAIRKIEARVRSSPTTAVTAMLSDSQAQANDLADQHNHHHHEHYYHRHHRQNDDSHGAQHTDLDATILHGRDGHGSHNDQTGQSDGGLGAYPVGDVLPSTATGHHMDPNDDLPPFDMDEHSMFPSMEGFFGGGFLDFMR